MDHLLDYLPELDIAFPAAAPFTPPAQGSDTEMAYGAELLEASAGSGAGLPAFLAGLIGRSGPSGRAALRLPLGRALMSALLQAASVLMPFGSKAAQQRGAAIFGMELEGLGPEDKEFALARQFIRLARELISVTLASGRPVRLGPAAASADADSRVQAALVQAARKHAPGLLYRAAQEEPAGGRWQRSGKRIVVLNC